MSTLQSSSCSSAILEHLEENGPHQECKDVCISSLPKEKSQLSLYDGYWIPTWSMPGVLAFQKYFQARETDILLVTPPKAGTTWFKAILFALVNRMRYLDLQEHPLLTNISHALVPLLDVDIYNKKKVPDLNSFASPRLFATHLPFDLLPTSVKGSSCKIVYVCRNPKDNFVSLWHFMNRVYSTTNSLEEDFDKFCRGVSLYGPYWDHVLSYWKPIIEKQAQKILFLKYEEMKEQPTTHLKRIAEFLECPFSPEEDAKEHNNTLFRQGIDHASFFRKGNSGDWVNYFTPQMTERLDHIIEEKFHGTGLKF
ncbi:cytosolic sulfotransferase 5-like isoform X2 [Carya illinoinensis]|uniref:Sulfotransferase n=1 Tax=Carya illinoinensis TaxID=32201 RepID=A0A922JKM9_CARIL|nr:cytosolic sulfotransferase 5-like isoform X2 [Carya illinoinensis]KAG6711320.1 hypothetical protein I3842_05G046600 [Carya illinoinensis]